MQSDTPQNPLLHPYAQHQRYSPMLKMITRAGACVWSDADLISLLRDHWTTSIDLDTLWWWRGMAR